MTDRSSHLQRSGPGDGLGPVTPNGQNAGHGLARVRSDPPQGASSSLLERNSSRNFPFSSSPRMYFEPRRTASFTRAVPDSLICSALSETVARTGMAIDASTRKPVFETSRHLACTYRPSPEESSQARRIGPV
jgi:hypothetical protein